MQLKTIDSLPLEMWAGLECTINRVGTEYYDQLARNGHYERPGDIDLLAGLGVRSVRYPVLWERHQTSPDKEIDWSFAQQNLERLKKHGITPIAGLVHHGSGPDWVSFYDGSFEKGLEAYALQVAQQFPLARFFHAWHCIFVYACIDGYYCG